MAADESCELNSGNNNETQKPADKATFNSVQIEDGSKDDEPPLSKRARKRLLKHEKWLEYRPIKRAKEKEKLKKKREEARLKNIKLGPTRKQLKNREMLANKSKLRIVLDFSFDHLMTNKDMNKCVNQMSRCYSVNRRAERPLYLHVTNFCGKSKEIMQKHVGYHNWDVHFWMENYLDIFKKEELIYLTSDSDNVIENLDESYVYIIGALVDHNYHKGICLKKAEEQGIKHGRLPISEFLEMKSRKVLTVDHVYTILVNVASNGMSWKQAFLKVIPQRKGASAKSSVNDDNEDRKEDDI
uniref:tRNA (guanine(9)-N(1))-methyltransferase n=1 Tax=Panstrongylus megistus TaxID=65343 RepID=A0A069DYI4_9HEMI